MYLLEVHTSIRTTDPEPKAVSFRPNVRKQPYVMVRKCRQDDPEMASTYLHPEL